ncbi:SUKH-4 family immunity protein [Kitasatospora sp. NBC_00070]|uniref:SUKH-4 family immunity protein n=1 Tax=Kitasatospora sp. NBC_00070 TaxID=2975962 RepID=UPI00324D02C9
MITQELALSTADAWLNGSGGAQREVRFREFDLGWVVWAAPAPLERDPVTGQRRPPADLGDACGVIDRQSGALSVWSSIPVDEVIEAYRERSRPATGPGNTLTATYPHPTTGEDTVVELASAPGRPPVEHQLVAELSRRGVPAGAVRAIHTALRPATLPGGYGAALLEQHFPTATVTFNHPYGITAAERAEGIAALTERVRPATRPNPVPAPAPETVTPAEPVRDVALGRQLPAAFGEVIRYDADDLAASALPESTRSTLTWAGLPADLPLFLTADRHDTPPPGGLFADLRTHLTAAGSPVEAATLDVLAGWTRIGSDGLCAIAVQTTGDEAGSVWAVHPRTGSGRFVNSSVSAYIRSLALLATTRPTLSGLDPKDAGTALAALQTGLAEIDPDAFRKDTTWWTVVTEQIWHGLL